VPVRGVGHAFREFVRRARHPFLVSLDMDLTVDLAFVPTALDLLETHDIVVGSKKLGNQNRTLFRRLGSDAFLRAVRLLLGITYEDYSIAAKAFRVATLRVLLFSGYGLGDDPNYFIAFNMIERAGTYYPSDPYQMRFGIWVPVVFAMKLFGQTELGFVGGMLLCSIFNLILVYLLARQQWEWPYALLAMALLAVFPLDVLCSTLRERHDARDVVLHRALPLPEGGRRERATVVRFVCALASGVFLLSAS
jgi:hypothetical protein